MESLFVAPPGWSWDIVLYFFFGGLAGGCYFLASMLRLVGGPGDLRASRIGYYLAFPLVNICALLLIKDLGVPERFWHMLVQSENVPRPLFKWWSPISFGSWIVAACGLLPVISFVHALLEGGLLRQPRGLAVTGALHDGGSWIGRIFLVLAALLGLLLAGYTGMLLAVTNTPTWGRDPLLPAIFMASGVSTAAATLFLIAHATAGAHATAERAEADTRARLLRTGVLALGTEVLLIIAAALLAIGHPSPFYLGWWAALFWLLVLPIGLLAPLALLAAFAFRGRELLPNAAVIGAALLVLGGLLFRTFEVFGGQAYYVAY